MELKRKVIIGLIIVLGIYSVHGSQCGAEMIKNSSIEETSHSMQEETATEVKQKNEIFMLDKGYVEPGYVLSFEEEVAMLSRDGSECRRVISGEQLILPGTYFLTTLNKEDKFLTTKLTIEEKVWQDTWKIEDEKALDEIIRMALKEFRTHFAIQFNYGEFSLEEINQILFRQVQEVLATYPKLTFESYVIRGAKGENPLIEVEINYPLQEVEELRKYDKETDYKIMDILSRSLTANQKDYEREWELFQYLIQSTVYGINREANQEESLYNPMMHTMFGTVIDKIAVCDGYAKTMMYMLNAIGIPTKLVFGEADGVAHVWNQVKIQEAYYHTDVTWADVEEKQLGGFYDYFNEMDDYMLKTHRWEQNLWTPCKEQSYALTQLPLTLERVERVNNAKEWNDLLNKVQINNLQEGSIILYNEIANKWDVREVIKELCNTLSKSIEYNIIEKYNTLIINYKVY